jgi:ABC-2 type transport system permease protein
MFGSQVMRGVIEEKTSRIVEVIVSSVKPFQLMFGKIIGVGMVGLTQFLLWVILTGTIVGVVMTSFSGTMEKYAQEQVVVKNNNNIFPEQNTNSQLTDSDLNAVKAIERINNINFPLMLGSFLFFFLFGYLMYAAVFAAIGGAVDNEADTQQFMLPITVPLILAIVTAQFIALNPHGPMAFWFSIIPLTSPISMMIRLPFGVEPWELALSMGLLILGFLGMVWTAGKIYRTGILMYGKKITYKELWKWLRHT